MIKLDLDFHSQNKVSPVLVSFRFTRTLIREHLQIEKRHKLACFNSPLIVYRLAFALLLNFKASRTPRSNRTSSEPPKPISMALFTSWKNLPGTMSVGIPREIASIRAPWPVFVNPRLFRLVYTVSPRVGLTHTLP